MLLAITIGGCRKLNQGGKMTVRMTDAPGIYDEVNVDIRQVSLHYTDTNASGKWVNLNTNAGVYDLLKLQNDVTVVLAGDSTLPLGKINQMRLLLGPDNYVVIDSVKYDLKVPSGMQTGIKMNLNTEIKTNSDVEVLIDFDAGKSVVVLGNGTYSLKPVIKVESVIEK